MPAERYEAHGFLSPVAPQNLAYCAFQIVVPQHPEYAAKVLKRQLVRLQKRLMSGVQIGPMKCRAAGIERIANTCTLVRSPARSAQASYQST